MAMAIRVDVPLAVDMIESCGRVDFIRIMLYTSDLIEI